MYKIREDNAILRKSDGAWIPKSTDNSGCSFSPWRFTIQEIRQ